MKTLADVTTDDTMDNTLRAQRLIEQALMGGLDSEGAIWRLVDAVGMLSERHPQAIGRATPTGQGYQIRRITNR